MDVAPLHIKTLPDGTMAKTSEMAQGAGVAIQEESKPAKEKSNYKQQEPHKLR